MANLPIALYRGMKIGQISFFKMTSPVERPYGSRELGSKYQGQSTPTAVAVLQGLRRPAPRRHQGRPAPNAMINETVDWSRDLGGGTRIALIQAGWFTTDAGAAFGPVPRIMWQKLVEAETQPRQHAQPGAQLPARRDAGRARADRNRDRRADGRAPPRSTRSHGQADPAEPPRCGLRPRLRSTSSRSATSISTTPAAC